MSPSLYRSLTTTTPFLGLITSFIAVFAPNILVLRPAPEAFAVLKTPVLISSGFSNNIFSFSFSKYSFVKESFYSSTGSSVLSLDSYYSGSACLGDFTLFFFMSAFLGEVTVSVLVPLVLFVLSDILPYLPGVC